MAASNSGGFLWTEEKSSIILDIMTYLLISKKLDPLVDGTIEMVLSKIVEFKDFTMFRGITTLCWNSLYILRCNTSKHCEIFKFYYFGQHHLYRTIR